MFTKHTLFYSLAIKKKTTKSCSFSWLARTIHCLSQYLVSICFAIFVASLMSFRWFRRLVGIGNRIVMMPRYYNRALGIGSYCCIRLFTVTWAQQEKCFLILRKFIITHKLLSTEAFISSIMCYERKKKLWCLSGLQHRKISEQLTSQLALFIRLKFPDLN